MYKIYCRIYQGIYRLASYIMPWRQPELTEGENSLAKLPGLIKSAGIKNVLIVTDRMIEKLGLSVGLKEGLAEADIKFIIYDNTVSNPTIDNIEEALKIYKENGCAGIVAFGGGSPMDCAKGVGARIAKPGKSLSQLKGQLKILKRIPPLFAVPTTAGTGSECTLAAVITDSNTHEKYAINDMSLIPHYAVLDPALTVNLPRHITSTTGMDALTHAVEAYIGKSNTKETRRCARQATELVFDNLFEAYSNGSNINARSNMQKAAHLAGLAFTRAYVGYVHAIAHTLGGLYSMPHGLANAVILPYVLEYFGKPVHKRLAELADLVKLTQPSDTNEQKANKFIKAIKSLNKSMDIPKFLSGIKDSDIPIIIKRALKEANPLYPVPKILFEQDINNIIQKIKE